MLVSVDLPGRTCTTYLAVPPAGERVDDEVVCVTGDHRPARDVVVADCHRGDRLLRLAAVVRNRGGRATVDAASGVLYAGGYPRLRTDALVTTPRSDAVDARNAERVHDVGRRGGGQSARHQQGTADHGDRDRTQHAGSPDQVIPLQGSL